MATTASNASSEGSHDLFWPLGALAHSVELTDKQVHIHTHKQIGTVQYDKGCEAYFRDLENNGLKIYRDLKSK